MTDFVAKHLETYTLSHGDRLLAPAKLRGEFADGTVTAANPEKTACKGMVHALAANTTVG